ncbi:flagellar protein FlgN [Neiella marina]|uniref:Flagellar protein FlgN n=1 Tax=Neiella holothuriorum TaxID=2870530 RepID=A0ABS7EET0_9GAMM|nr:flagellar export chaperone FlgN [Neiella holothuriorum]MBW8190849.1 flagellar protein FlgN [Neiella holothuriorum]
MNQEQAATALIEKQLERLKLLQQLLVEEQQVLSERKFEELAAIPPRKTALLQELQLGDQALGKHKLDTEAFRTGAIKAKSQLKLCKQLNETNGRMIALAMTSISRLQNAMVKAGQQSTMTYTAQGGASGIGSSGNVVSV